MGVNQLAELMVFARVAEAGSVSGAAVQLGLSKSAVSKQLARLEDRLGSRLFNRTTRRLSLTEAGQALLRYAERALAEAEAGEEAVSHLRAAPRGLLRINAPMSFGQRHLAPLLEPFLALYPELSLDVTLEDRFVDLVEEGYDMALRIDRMPDSSLIARRIAPVRSVLCAAPAYVERRGAPDRPEALGDHDCLYYSYHPGAREWRFQDPEGTERVVRVGGRVTANNGDLLRCLALDGLGVLAMPTFIVGPDICAGRLRMLLPGWALPAASLYAVFPHSRHLLPKVRVFVDFLVERFGPEPYWEPEDFRVAPPGAGSPPAAG